MNNEFGDFLRSLRLDRGMSTHQLAELSGVSQSYIAQVENGRKKNPPSPEIIRKLATALNRPYVLLMNKAGHVDDNEVHRTKVNDMKILQLLEGILLLSEELNDLYLTTPFLRERFLNLAKKFGYLDANEFLNHFALKKIHILEEKRENMDDFEMYYDEHKKLFDELLLIIQFAEKIKNQKSEKIDFIDLLNMESMTFNGHELSSNEIKRIISMLEVMFPDYNSNE